MEQRRLRLGDILDDYCPRERRVTNHAIVAMIEDDIKQTRCTTCDAEHPYKGGKAPRRKKKETPTTLYKEVLAGMPDSEAAPLLASHAPASVREVPPTSDQAADNSADEHDHYAVENTSDSAGAESVDEIAEVRMDSESESHEDDPGPNVEEGPVHRPLIRATLPRPEGQKDARPLPEFTIRQSGGRNGNFRDARGGSAGSKMRGGGHGANGNRAHGGGGPRFAGARPGHGRGQASRGPGGFRSPQQPRHGGGGKKRSR
jgi:hypothetical protein